MREGERGLSDELVTDAMHRKDVLRLINVVLYLLTQASDVIIDSAGGRVRVVPPDLIKELVSGDDRALFRDEVAQQAVLASGEIDWFLVAKCPIRLEVDYHIRESHFVHCARTLDATKQGANSGQELQHSKRLSKIIVCTEVETEHLVYFT
jgi:hypothetical protein